VDTVVSIPEEICDLNPQKTCRSVNLIKLFTEILNLATVLATFSKFWRIVSQLLVTLAVNDEHKMFIKVTPEANVRKLFTAASYDFS
jgi:hypothetical protein